MNTKEYLQKAIESNHPNRIEAAKQNAYSEVRREIAEFLQTTFPMHKERAGNPFNAGSWEKNTAVNVRFDLDLVVPFKFRDSMYGPKNIKNDVYQALHEKFDGKNGFLVSEQRVSTGLSVTREGQLIEIDVVAGMETEEGSYIDAANDPNHEGKFMVLFDKDADRKIKTNVHRQIHQVKTNLVNCHDAIRLLKIWKKTGEKPISSYPIELMAWKAQKASGMKNGSADEILRIILDESLKELPNLELNDIGLGKPWPDFLDPDQQSDLKKDFLEIQKALDPIRPDLDLLKQLFPLNEKYVEPKPKTFKGYGSSSYA